MVVVFLTRPRDTGCLSKPGGLKKRKHSSLFSTQLVSVFVPFFKDMCNGYKLYPIMVANLPICCNITLPVMVVMQSDV
jgi:hypothetical protein